MGNNPIKQDMKNCDYYHGDKKLKYMRRMLFNEPLGTYAVSSLFDCDMVVLTWNCPISGRTLHRRIHTRFGQYYHNKCYYTKIDDIVGDYPDTFYRPLYRYKP
ncbi:I7L [African swine fever virus]|uniref:I7L n=1 Tax=African swine fever virus TaxID=10497 RepID=A0A0C5B2B9_ASF|nr:I7L [African swine fever virus]AJL34161.1 I7L [African swine fever virus]AXB49377.1 pI7L [African swine fever virus]AXB49551.1 pI7L [African swine fever virus]AXB49723.1 pI7L [African swine fever virus]AXB49894.1 pI7L [African swine fever virus]